MAVLEIAQRKLNTSNKMFSCKTTLLSTHLVVQRQFRTVYKYVN